MDARELAGSVASYLRGLLSEKGVGRAIAADTALITSGLLSSIEVLGLVAHIEDETGIEIEAHEISPDSMDTLADIVRLVTLKQEAS